jgi:hypothetical protein
MMNNMESIKKLSRRNSPWSILLLVLALGIFTACEERPAVDDRIVEDDEFAVEEPMGPSVSDITSNPETYEGQMVTVQGEVDEVLNNTGFRLSEGMFGEGLLVIHQRTTTPNDRPDQVIPMEGEEARVRGTVALMTKAEIQQQYQLHLDDDMDAEVDEMERDTAERQAVLIAESVTRAVGSGALQRDDAFGAERTVPETEDERVARDGNY